jgi:hypothetical protein
MNHEFEVIAILHRRPGTRRMPPYVRDVGTPVPVSAPRYRYDVRTSTCSTFFRGKDQKAYLSTFQILSQYLEEMTYLLPQLLLDVFVECWHDTINATYFSFPGLSFTY